MESLRADILKLKNEAGTDEAFIEQVQTLIALNGDSVCQVVFEIFTDLEFIPKTARKYWEEILTHRKDMGRSLGRKVGMVPAMVDYFCLNTPYFSNPKMVDFKTFDQVIHKSIHDSLTGLMNRQYLMEILEHQISYSDRYDTHLSVLFLDVDDFKDINDSFGHAAGDEALRMIANTILKEKRDSDVAFRYGGEEFIVTMPNTDNVNAVILAERIRESVEKLQFSPEGFLYSLTVSGGIATFPIHAKKMSDILNYADSALYRAKGAGKNNISLFTKDNRRYLRIKVSKPVMVRPLNFEPSKKSKGVSKDICIGGILFESEEKIAVGTPLQVGISFQGEEPLILIGTVVRTELIEDGRYDIGMSISFKEMDKMVKNEIASFLTEQSRKQSSTD